MYNEMSHAQRLLLQAAAAREDRFLQPPGTARGAVTKSLAAKLIDAGWAKEIKASNGAPVWRSAVRLWCGLLSPLLSLAWIQTRAATRTNHDRK